MNWIEFQGQSSPKQVQQTRSSVDIERIKSQFMAVSDDEEDIFLPSKLENSQKSVVQFERPESPVGADMHVSIYMAASLDTKQPQKSTSIV